jgi:hypothetical protein
MLPTPVKTPRKKNVPATNAAARALFLDQDVEPEIVAPSPRRSRKNKRYNGFSLESFTANDDDTNGRIQIFTDNRDKIPEADTADSNPFAEDATQKPVAAPKARRAGTKRQKISGEAKIDPQVANAIKNDDGMVYVFRGKKIFKRFDDSLEEEEVIDPEDLGMLSRTADAGQAVKALKTLTRKSVKPTRLFQKEQAVLPEEGADTDIEAEVEIQAEPQASSSQEVESRGKSRSKVDAPNRASPFDSWPRVKSGTRRTASGAQKRSAEDMDIVEEAGASASTSGVPANTRVRRTRV